MRKTPVDVDTRWGSLVVLRKLPGKNEHGHVRWECRCDCGRKVAVWGYSLAKKSRNTRSCGMGACHSKAVSQGIWASRLSPVFPKEDFHDVH